MASFEWLEARVGSYAGSANRDATNDWEEWIGHHFNPSYEQRCWALRFRVLAADVDGQTFDTVTLSIHSEGASHSWETHVSVSPTTDTA